MARNRNSPSVIAFFTSLSILGISVFFSMIFRAIHDQIGWFSYLLGFISFFAFTYFIIFQTLDTFIYRKIKLIYKNIHRLKLGKDSLAQQYEEKRDIIEDVNQEVANWAENQNAEIAHLKMMAQYRREFLGNVSHELKTPIFSIQGYLLTLLDGGVEDPNIRTKYLKRAESSIDRMIEMVDDLEKITALESGELGLEIKNFDITELIQDIIESYEIAAKEKGVRIFLNSKEQDSFIVKADRDHIYQVFTNLIDNALKYMGTPLPLNPRVKISLYSMDKNVLVEVSDNGIGVDENDIPRLFERFFRVDKGRSREHGGTGLGLAIVKHIIEAHNQTINVRSTKNIGTTFSFTLEQKG